MSRNDSVLLACGSRSMSSVGLPRSASAAARLIAVVVFPTPPFWLAMATIIWGIRRARGLYQSERRRDRVIGESGNRGIELGNCTINCPITQLPDDQIHI